MKEKDKKQAIFWCRLLYPVIYEELEGEKLTGYIESLSQKEVTFPNGKRKKPSKATLWRKLALYRKGGWEALCRRPRSDRGKARVVDQEVIDKAIELKKEAPTRSSVILNQFLDEYYGKTVAPSTLYRHLREAHATRVKLGASKKKVRCRWSRDHSNSLWVGDIEYGPYVIIDGQSRRTYLSAFIDCHSRYIVAGRYYLRENTPVLIDTLLRAWQIHGKPRALYADNGKIYYSEQLEAACLSMQIRLMHRPPRDPEPGGIIEKFFQTVQSRFETEVRVSKILDLNKLNRAFAAWLEVDYHEAINRETGEKPRQRYEKGLVTTEPVDLDHAIRFFMLTEKRKVNVDFSDVSLDAKLYRVDPRLRGDKVLVRYDPFGDRSEVLIYSLKEEYLGVGKLHQREKREQPQIPTQSPKVQHDYLDLLVTKHERKLRRQSEGVDFSEAVKCRPWPFLKFITTLAQLMGRKGGASAFSGEEYQALQQIYDRLTDLTETMLLEAFERAEYKDIVNITYQLQKLRKES